MARKSRKISVTQQAEAAVPVKVFQTAIYARLSVADTRDGDGGTLEDQIALVKGYVDSKPELKLAGIFSDNGKTGTNFERGGFESMMKAVKDGSINCIVFKDLSRFARNHLEAGNYLETIFPFLGVRVISVNDNWDSFDSHNAGDRLDIAIKNLVHDFYSKDLSGKIKAALRVKMKNGDFIGDYAPYGYKKSEGNKNRLVVDSEAADVVRDIFKWRLEGQTPSQIARRLNEMNVLTPQNYKYTRGYVKAKRYEKRVKWYSALVQGILTNICYAGHTVNGKSVTIPEDGYSIHKVAGDSLVVVENTHEAIITASEFERVQDLFRESREKFHQSRASVKIPDWPRQENLFQGIAYCAECGNRMHRFNYTVKSEKMIKFSLYCQYCRDTVIGDKKPMPFRQYELESAVIETIKRQIETCAELQKIIGGIRVSTAVKAQGSALKVKISSLERRLAQIKSRTASLYCNLQEGLITAEEFTYMKNRYDSERESGEANLSELRKSLIQYEDSSLSGNQWVKAIESIAAPEQLSKETIHALIDRIEITYDKRVFIRFKYRDAFKSLLSLARQSGENDNGGQ